MKKKSEEMILGLICFILTIAICIQIRSVNFNGATVSNNEVASELKSQVLRMKEKYERQYEEFKRMEKELEDSRKKATENNEGLKELEEKIKSANTLLGNTDVYGPGVIITLDDGKIEKTLDIITAENYSPNIHGQNIRDVVYILKNAGAQAIEVNGERIVENTAFVCDGTVLSVNGVKINTPVTIQAIGVPELILSSLNMNSGILETFATQQKKVEIKKSTKIYIKKYNGVFNFKYANTVS